MCRSSSVHPRPACPKQRRHLAVSFLINSWPEGHGALPFALYLPADTRAFPLSQKTIQYWHFTISLNIIPSTQAENNSKTDKSGHFIGFIGLLFAKSQVNTEKTDMSIQQWTNNDRFKMQKNSKTGTPLFPRDSGSIHLVRVMGLEPIRLTAQEPKSCTSANSVIPAQRPPHDLRRLQVL